MDFASGSERPRVLLKDFRKRRHPKRSSSLPSLQLAPENRPLFICQRCHFANPVCELCPWCLSPCDVAAPVQEIRHRVSSPSLLSDAQKMQLAALERRTRPRVPDVFPNTATSSSRPRAMRDLPAGASEFKDAPSDLNSVRRRHRNAVLYSATDVVATATLDATLQPFLDEIAAAHLENRERRRQKTASSISTPPLSVCSSPPPSTPSRTLRPSPPPRTPPRTPPPKSRSRMSRSSQDVDAPHTSEPRSDLSTPPHTPQMQSLRRKRRMSILRQRSSCSLRRRATTSGTGSHRRDGGATSPPSPTNPRAASLSHKGRSSASIRFGTPPPGSAGPDDTIPLGHPQRPLYTAIRKNMSRPESPSFSRTPSPSLGRTARVNVNVLDAAFETVVYERGTRSLDIEHPAARAAAAAAVQPFGSLTRSSYMVAAAARPFPSSTGFSVSGETEFRMDLARSRSMDGVPSDFAFREVKPDVSMKKRVKNFGKTLRGLLRVMM